MDRKNKFLDNHEQLVKSLHSNLRFTESFLLQRYEDSVNNFFNFLEKENFNNKEGDFIACNGDVYILTPKSFYFLLPPLFRKTKFYGLCINDSNTYKRPGEFLRKYLFKYVINNRAAIFKRDSTEMIQYELTKNINQLSIESNINIDIDVSDALKKYLPKDYFYFHLKKQRLDALEWGISEIKLLLDELLKYSPNVVITKDIEVDENSKILKENFNSFDFKNNNYLNKNKKIIFFDNIDGQDIYNVIKLSSKIVAFHGMMTSLGSINKKKILDFILL